MTDAFNELSARNELQRRFADLASMEPMQRAAELPGLLATAFERAGFRAEVATGAGSPRDTDLFLWYDDEYLVEVKWTRHKPGIAEVDELRSRLRRTAPHVIGLLVSISGFAQSAFNAVEADRSRPILLFDRMDIDVLLSEDRSIAAVLRLRKRSLVRDAVALVGGRTRPRARTAAPAELPGSVEYLVDADGHELPWLQIDGSPGDIVFVDQVPDVDWLPAQDHGVGLDLSLPVHSAADLADVFRVLGRLGWVTNQGRYAIQQPTYGWHGCGARGLLEALQLRPARHRSPRRRWHNEEHLTYFDAGPDWFYTLTSRVWIKTERLVDVQLSMQLTGVPVDSTRYRVLLEALGLDERAYFRPLDGKNRPTSIPLRSQSPLTMRGQIRERSRGEEWVKGILIEAPALSYDPPLDFDMYALSNAKQWICRLRGWHQASHAGVEYSLSDFEQTWTDTAHVLSVTADWTSPATQSAPVIMLEAVGHSPAELLHRDRP